MQTNKMEPNYEAWARNAVTFIREKGLDPEFTEWCGGFPCPIVTPSGHSLKPRAENQTAVCEALNEAINYLAVYAVTAKDDKASNLLNKYTAALAARLAASS